MKTLFLDESGDYNPETIDPQYPVFVLGGVIADDAYAAGPMTDALNDFKSDLFGRTDIVLHTADIARKRNGFEALRDAGLRARFYRRLNELMREMQYSALACAIHKHPDQWLTVHSILICICLLSRRWSSSSATKLATPAAA